MSDKAIKLTQEGLGALIKKNLVKESITGDIDMDFGRTGYSKDDYVKGVAELESDAMNKIKSELNNIKFDFTKIGAEDGAKIADFLKDVFGTTKPEINKENAKKLSKALGLDSVLSEGDFKQGENIVVKIIGRLKQLLGINQAALFGIPLAVLMTAFAGAPGFIITLVGGWVLLRIFMNIMEKFGYDENATLGGIGHYNPKNDIRNTSSELYENNKIKITPEQLKQLISEEASKHKQRLELQKQKDAILSQLNELNGKK